MRVIWVISNGPYNDITYAHIRVGWGKMPSADLHAGCAEFRVPAHAPGRSIICSNNVMLVLANKILKRVAN